MAFMALATTVSTGAASTVRNSAPERARSSTDTQWRVAHSGGGRRVNSVMKVTVEHELRRFIDLHSAMRYDEALHAARGLVDAVPDRALTHYNLACVLSRLHRTDQAFEALDRSIDLGWRNDVHALIDPDLEVLRRDDRFASRVARIRRMTDAERIEPRPLRRDAVERVARDLERGVPELLDRYQIPGVTVAVVRDGRVAWTGAFGAADPAAGVPMTDATVFRVGAPVHLLSLIAATQLDMQERLDLSEILIQAEGLVRRSVDQPEPSRAFARRYAHRRQPGIHAPPVRQWRARPLRAQWTDSVGVVNGPAPSHRERWPGVPERHDVVDLFRVSIELGSRQDFDQYCRGRVLAALAMGHSHLASEPVPEVRRRIQRAAPHTALGTPLDPALPDSRSAARRLDTTAGDLARLMSIMMSARSPSADRVLPGAARARLRDAMGFGLDRLGLGVRVTATPSGERFDVADADRGAGCLMRWYPDAGCGVVVLFNADGATACAVRIAALALGGE